VTPQQLWHEDILDAIKADVVALGGPKSVGLALWPEKSAEAAARHLLDCINRDRNQRLTPEQLTLLIREARGVNSFCTIAYICSDANLSMPVPVEPEDERARLQREFIDAVGRLDKIKSQLNKV
jgi:hypothetical protein